MLLLAVRVRIMGQVQGVWYRSWTKETAICLGLSGWVRNRRDGSVEAVFYGSRSEIDQMLLKCYDGPLSAQVDQVLVDDEPSDVLLGFTQLPTL
jgi:acylphosphatase